MLINTLIELHGQNEVEELLRAENRDGYTPLLLAIMRKTPESKEIIEVLLDDLTPLPRSALRLPICSTLLFAKLLTLALFSGQRGMRG